MVAAQAKAKRFLILLMAAFALSSCAPAPMRYLSLQKSENFKGTIEQELKSIDDDLRTRIGEEVLFRDEAPYKVLVQYGPEKKNSDGLYVLGQTEFLEKRTEQNVDITITIANALNPDDAIDEETKATRLKYIRAVLRHEIGHAFGLKHVDVREDIMYPHYDQSQLNDASFQKFAEALNGVRNSKL